MGDWQFYLGVLGKIADATRDLGAAREGERKKEEANWEKLNKSNSKQRKVAKWKQGEEGKEPTIIPL